MAWTLTPQYEHEIRRNWIDQDRWAKYCDEHRIARGDDHEVLKGLRHARQDIATLLSALDKVRGERDEALDARNRTVNQHARSVLEMRQRADEVEAGVRRAEAAIRAVWGVKVWTNEDGKQFMFADEVNAALAAPISAHNHRTAAASTPPIPASGVGRG